MHLRLLLQSSLCNDLTRVFRAVTQLLQVSVRLPCDLKLTKRLGVQFGGSEHSRTSRARVQRRISRRAAEMPTLFANQSRAFGFRILSRLTRPVLFLVPFFASGTFDQHLAA